MDRPDLELVHDRDNLPVGHLTAEYWRAARSLRGPDDAPVPLMATARFPRDLARNFRPDWPRRAAVGTLTSLGLHDHVSPGDSPGPEAA
jgi:hypothetical protein